MNDDPLLHQLKVKARDRQYQLWERNSLSTDIFTEEVFIQKLNYIHYNPLQPKWNLSLTPESYKYSSAGFMKQAKQILISCGTIKNDIMTCHA